MGQRTGNRREILKGNFLMLASSGFLFVLGGYLLVPMMPLYLGSLGALESEIGFIIGLVPLTTVFSCIPIGRFIDRHGCRGMLLAGILSQMASPFLYVLCTDTTQFMAVRVLNGVGFAAFLVASQTLVIGIAPRGRLGEVLGIYYVGVLAARIIGPSFSGLLLADIGYVSIFYLSGLLGLAAAAVALLIKVPARPESMEATGGFAGVLRNRNLSTSSLAIAALMVPHGMVSSFIPLYAVSLGLGPEGVGLFFGVYALAMGGVRPFTGIISDRIGRVTVVVPGALLSAAGVLVFTVVDGLAGLLVAGALLGMGMGTAVSVLYALSIDTIQPRLRGQAVAVSTTTADLGISIGSMSMGPVIVMAGYATAFVSTAAIVIVGIVAFIAIRAVWKKDEKVYT